jgi:hypothetical protein
MAPALELLALLEPAPAARRPAEPEAPPRWLQAVAGAAQRASLEQLVVAGLLAHPEDLIGERRVLAAAGSGAPDGLWLLQLPPGRQHRALAWLPDSAGPWCQQVWLDGHALAPPAGSDLGAGALLPGHWADDDTWALPFAPLEHPLQDWSRNVGLGLQRGLWVVQATTGTSRLLLPPPDQRWPDPRLVPAGRDLGWRVQPELGALPVNVQ